MNLSKVKNINMDKGFDNPFSPKQKPVLSTEIVRIDDIPDFSLGSHSQDLSRAKELGNNRKRFWNLLASTVNRTGYISPENRTVQVLDVACGKCFEGVALSAYFGGNRFGHPSPDVLVTGIDTNSPDIQTANEGNLTYDLKSGNWVPMFNYQFICGDATQLDKYPQIPQQADVVVIRHQEISSNEQIWRNIFQQSISRLDENGICIITSFSDQEHEMLIEALGQLDCEIVLNEENQYAKPSETQGLSIDKKVAIIRKKRK